jgi:hypothetical protein
MPGTAETAANARAAYQAKNEARMVNRMLVGTESASGAIARVRYSHDAMIDLILGNPAIKQNAIAAHFSVSVGWVSRVINSDAFRARLAERKGDLIDPLIIHNMEEKLLGLMDQSLEIVAEKLESSKSPDLAIKALELSSKALGYGARKDNIGVQNNFVVALPAKSNSAADWSKQYAPGGVVDATPVDSGRSTQPPDRQEGSDLMRLAQSAGAA